MYWIEEVTAGHMDNVLIPYITVAHSQKGKTAIKWRQHMINHWVDVHAVNPRICELEESIVIV